MTSRFAAIIFSIGLFGFGNSASYGVSPTIEVGIDGPANCRDEPNGKNLKTIPNLARVSLRERKDDWYRVSYAGVECWTFWKNLRLNDGNSLSKSETGGLDVLQGISFTYYYSERPDEAVPADQVVDFACREFVNNRYLLNKTRTKVCWIKDPDDYAAILKGLNRPYSVEKTASGINCPISFKAPPYCDPKKLRSF